MRQLEKDKNFTLNGFWQFGFSAEHEWTDENLAGLTFPDILAVPSPFDSMPACNGKRGVGFYRRKFEVPAGRRARITFNAVGMYAKVFIDGRKAGESYAPYTPFTVDVPVAETNERELIVMACNRFDYQLCPLQENYFDFYAYGGIFRDVELRLLPDQDAIDWIGVETLDYLAGKIRVRVCPVRPGQTLTVAIDREAPQTVAAGETVNGETSFELTVKNFTPWSPETPELHMVTVGNGTDERSVRFGIRQVKAEKGHILLNGKPLKLLGYCRHEAHPLFGPALPPAQMVADLELLRDLGCNFIRGTHYQQDPRFLDLCDEMGFLVWEEGLSWGARVQHFTNPNFVTAQVAQIEAMIKTSYNHPSVIIRGFLNEGESETLESEACYKTLIGLVRKNDSTRLVTYASHRRLDDRWLELVDVISFNMYPGWYPENKEDESPLGEIIPYIRHNLEGIRQRGLADKPFIISEIGAGAIYGWRDPICSHWSEDYQREYLRIVCREIVDNPSITGVALWQFCDCRTHRGAYALGRPRAFNNKGTVDEYRRPKLAYEVVKNIFKESVK